MEKNKSQLAKDLEHALFVCSQRDALSRLADDETITDKHAQRVIWDCFLKSNALLAEALDTGEIQVARDKKRMRYTR